MMQVRFKIVAGVLVVSLLAGSSPVAALHQEPKDSEGNAAYAATAPETPNNFRLVSRNGSQLRFDWDWVAGGTGAIHYELSYADKTIILNQYYPGYTFDASGLNLGPGHVYTFSLRAVDAIGQKSAVPAQLVFETTPPTSPSGLKQLSTKLGYPDRISFTLSTDAASSIRGYEVFLNGRSFGIVAGVDNEFSLFDQVGAAYLPVPTGSTTVQLRAYDSSFNFSRLSDPLTVVFP